MTKSRQTSQWYRTSDVRIAPGIFGFMQAQQLWRRDCYDIYGETTAFQTKWRALKAVPQEVDDNLYSHLATKDGFWKKFIQFFPGGGFSDPEPSSPADSAKRFRNYQREAEEKQQIEDGYVPSLEAVKRAAEKDSNYKKALFALIADLNPVPGKNLQDGFTGCTTNDQGYNGPKEGLTDRGVNAIEIYDTETIPEKSDMQEGRLYYSNKYGIANHLCACGCGSETVTPISEKNWTLEVEEDGPTIRPSIGNQKFPCGSHYYITNGRIEWL